MSYQVLARKWRPRSFATMMGQEHVLKALINALDADRLHHAYLFTGTRGVGKTTVARIFAKSLNCETGVTSQPCGQCSACREIDEGRFVDLIEVDAASRTKVDDTRELLENVQYAPTRGRYKVYLIDEVHMLSTHSFNALLKTLEEPPPHVKFLLATTDPQKLPVTILSRCLQFNLKRLSVEMIETYLQHILQQEEVSAEPAAIRQIAEAADGSMRDGLSLLDQAISYGGGALRDDEVRTMLGTVDRRHVSKLLQALADNDATALLNGVHHLAQQGTDFAAVLAELVSYLHKLALAQQVPEVIGQDADAALLSELAARIAPEDVQLYYQIGVNGRRDLPYAPNPRAGLEMILLRMLAFRPVAMDVPAPVAPAPKSPPPSSQPAAPAAGPQFSSEPQRSQPKQETARPGGNGLFNWNDTIDRLGLQGMVQQLAVNSVFTGREGNTLMLSLSSQHASLRSDMLEQRLCDALQKVLGEPVKLKFTVGELDRETPADVRQRQAQARQQAAVEAINSDPAVQRFRDEFDAKVLTDTVRPVE